MKQQTTKNPPVTLDNLYELVKTLPTRDEVKQIVRAEIKDELEKYPTKYELEEMLTKLRSDFYDKVDPFLREIETAREEREIGSYQMEKVNRNLQNMRND